MSTVVVAALYKFVNLDNYQDLQQPLKEICHNNGIKGTLLLAQEGINGTVAGPREGIDALLTYLRTDSRFVDLDHKESYCGAMPFLRLKIRLKKEIVTIGLPEVTPTQVVGTYVNPDKWNELLTDPEVVVIDTRNDYEVAIGTFQGAIDPKTKTFGEFPEYVQQNFSPAKHRKVAMFCTGGIRCEKASSYMKTQGFEEVYHLKGGILKYLETVPAEESLWEGECFVFDQRVAVRHGLEVGTHTTCYGCRMPLTPEELESSLYEKGVSCPKCYHHTTPTQKKGFADRHRQITRQD